ncbi:MAG: Endonuclease/exonuclease/phosphatase [Rhizobacter sp.]|nr:Endonuclease/exonuclease/phosphatase [Rhizobacter sp.]
MTRTHRFLSFATTQALRLVVLVVVVGIVGLTVVQQAGRFGLWWVELTRYLPYPAVLGPALVAVLLSLRLGRTFVVASLAALVLAATATMGLAWPSPDSGSSPVRFMTYNAKAFKDEKHPSGDFSGQAQEVARHDPDILVMQDSTGINHVRADDKQTTAPLFGLPHVFGIGQYLIASRLPMRDCAEHVLRNDQMEQRYLSCVITAGDVEVTVATAHFESPRVGLLAARHEGIEGIDEWHRNYSERLAQSHALTVALRDAPRPLIVAGDLNAPEASPVVRSLLSLGLRDAFSAAGRGYGYSYGQAFRWGYSFLRIDHILVSPEIGVSKTVVGGGEASEHRPVISELFFKRS